MIRKLTTICLFFLQQSISYAYTVYPSCPDFTDIEASHVEAFYGDIYNPLQDSGLVSNRHMVIDTVGTDPNTGNLLQVLAPSESRVVRLGNENVGFEAEALRYHFLVDIEKSILEVKFAVVFQDPSHPFHQQPRFRVRIMDAGGNLLGDCSEYDVTSGNDLDGFNTYDDGVNAPVRWRDWSSLLIDLSRFAGSEVQVEFITYDCGQGAHYGYAYFTATCMKNQLSVQACSGSEVSLFAPPGYSKYLWDNGETTQSTTRIVDGSDIHVSCLLTNEMGCYYTLYGLISGSDTTYTSDVIIKDSICQGEPYAKNNFYLPVQTNPGDFTYYSSVVNPTNCGEEITVTLQLHVYQKYYNLYDAICFGEDYTEHDFSISQPAVGDHVFQKVYTSIAACDSVVQLYLTVNTAFKAPSGILGDITPCIDEPAHFYFDDVDTSVVYTWVVPNNATIISGQGLNHLYVNFDNDTQGQLFLSAENGCGSISDTIDLFPNPSYHYHLYDTICIGNSYANNGFVLPQQNEIGNFVYRNEFKTTMGCDSNFVLSLFVYPTPEDLKIVIERDTFICAGDSVTLHAISGNANYFLSNSPRVSVGDILCTDSTTVKPANYLASGKTAKGIVFYVDETGKHGWAASLYDLPGTYQWSTVNEDIIGIVNRSGTNRQVFLDIDGYNNTQQMLASGNAAEYPSAYAVDVANGWYIPAIGQLKMLSEQTYMIIDALYILGVDVFESSYYLSSSENSTFNSIRFSANVPTISLKTVQGAIRPIISF